MPYQFTVPLAPQTASRPNWTPHGRATRTFMPEKYRRWREDFNDWFIDFLTETDSELFYFLTHLQDGTWIRERDEEGNLGPVSDRFFGYAFELVFVLPRTAHETRALPIATRTADIDNYFKAVIDGIFESEPAKHYGLNDRWIQDIHVTKRYTWYDSDEKPHIEVGIKRIERVEGLYT